MKHDAPHRRGQYVLAVLFVWLAAVCVHAWLYVSSVLAHLDKIPEWYARSASFQLIAFAYVALPYWLLVLGVALLIVRFAVPSGQPGA